MASYTQQSGTWLPPKTDWADGQAFSLAPDYERIYTNTAYLYALAARLRVAGAVPLPQVQESDVPYADFFNTVESAVHFLAQQSYLPFGPRTYAANGTVWEAADLCRLEQTLAAAKAALAGRIAGRRQLAFRLGGGKGNL